MTTERALHEFVLLGCRMRVILWELLDEAGDARCGSVLEELDRLLKSTEALIPSTEQLKLWESERLAERKAKE